MFKFLKYSSASLNKESKEITNYITYIVLLISFQYFYILSYRLVTEKVKSF